MHPIAIWMMQMMHRVRLPSSLIHSNLKSIPFVSDFLLVDANYARSPWVVRGGGAWWSSLIPQINRIEDSSHPFSLPTTTKEAADNAHFSFLTSLSALSAITLRLSETLNRYL
jgi:hypothetical protein